MSARSKSMLVDNSQGLRVLLAGIEGLEAENRSLAQNIVDYVDGRSPTGSGLGSSRPSHINENHLSYE